MEKVNNEKKKFILNKKEITDILFRLSIVLISNILLSFATVLFLSPAKLYSGGATGLAQLIQGIIINCGGFMNLGLIIFLVNIPIAIIGFKFVSKRFAIYSIIAILVQSLATGILEETGWSPFLALALPIETTHGSIINYGGILTLAIFGGLISGVSAGLALKFGVSTGGIDVISQALALHKNISLGNVTLIFNILISIIGGVFVQGGNWIVVLFTIVRMILNSLVTDKIHTSYTYTGLHIFSECSQGIAADIMKTLKRGCTLIHTEGAYTHHPRTEVYCVVSTYEVENVLKIIDKYDPNAFVTLSPIKKIKGKFIKKTIV